MDITGAEALIRLDVFAALKGRSSTAAHAAVSGAESFDLRAESYKSWKLRTQNSELKAQNSKLKAES
jgi:hypothetical protein